MSTATIASATGSTLVISLRTGWKALAAWVIGIGATVLATTNAIGGLYDTPDKIRSYADAIGGGQALVVINGRVAGLDSLGGIVANEFGFLASFAIPLMAISLVARTTRKDEEQGRLEILLAGRIGRAAPPAAAMLVAGLALLATAAVLLTGLVTIGVPAGASLLYSASMAALGLVFAAAAALVAQLVEHSRGVYTVGLSALVVSYLLRGIGDVQVAGLAWLSPLGWQEKTQAFGNGRTWPLLVPLGVALVLGVLAVVLAARRDLGSALFARAATSPRASSFLRTPLGLVLRLHRGGIVGWSVGALVVAAVFGALSQPIVDAIAGNPSLADALGATGAPGPEAILSMTVLIIALLGGGYAVSAVGTVRGEETAGRLEVELSGTHRRGAWLGLHLLVIAVGLIVVTGVGAGALAAATWWSTGNPVAGAVATAVLAFLPAIGLLCALGTLLFSVSPRWQPMVWLVYAEAAVIAYLGDPLGLSRPVLALSPYHLVGSPPRDPADGVAVLLLAVAAVACLLVAFAGFRRRGIPQG